MGIIQRPEALTEDQQSRGLSLRADNKDMFLADVSQ